MNIYLTVLSTALIAFLPLLGSVRSDENRLIARGGGGGARFEGGARPMGTHPVARNEALQRTPALSRANVNPAVKGAALGYVAGQNSGSSYGGGGGYYYPSDPYYPSIGYSSPATTSSFNSGTQGYSSPATSSGSYR